MGRRPGPGMHAYPASGDAVARTRKGRVPTGSRDGVRFGRHGCRLTGGLGGPPPRMAGAFFARGMPDLCPPGSDNPVPLQPGTGRSADAWMQRNAGLSEPGKRKGLACPVLLAPADKFGGRQDAGHQVDPPSLLGGTRPLTAAMSAPSPGRSHLAGPARGQKPTPTYPPACTRNHRGRGLPRTSEARTGGSVADRKPAEVRLGRNPPTGSRPGPERRGTGWVARSRWGPVID